MFPFLIIAIIILSLCAILGIIMLIIRKKFTNPKRTYEFCFKIPKVIGIIEGVLLIIGLTLLICFYIFSDVNMYKTEFYLFSFLISLICGLLIGCIIGEVYWYKIKKPSSDTDSMISSKNIPF